MSDNEKKVTETEEIKDETVVSEVENEEKEVETKETESETKENEVESEVSDEKKDTEKESKESKGQSNTVIKAVIAIAVILLGILIFYVVKNPNTANKPVEKGDAITETSTKVNISVLEDALANLKKKDNYIISTLVNAPMGMTSYIEYVTPEYSATMVDDNNIEKAYQEIDLSTATFRINDVIKDGHLYFLYNEATDEGAIEQSIYQAPDSYAKICDSRRYMFFDWVVKDLKDLEFAENVETDLGNGTVSLDVYKGKLSADVVKKILGNGTVGLYQCVQDETDSEGLKKLMGWLIDDIDFTLVYSDANVLVGVVDGSLAYLNFELGGLGTKMYVTKCFIENTDVVSSTELPDFNGAIPYEELYASYGEMALDFDSLDEMYNNLYSENNPSLTDEELQKLLDEAVQKTEEEHGTDVETEVVHDGDSTDTNTETPSEVDGGNTETTEEGTTVTEEENTTTEETNN